MSAADPTALGAVAIAQAVSARRLRAGDVAEAFVARIAAVNPTLNAIVQHDPAAVSHAAADIDRRVDAGEDLPLAGVPFTTKDNLWVGGMTVTQGSRLFRDFVAPADAVAVERLRRAGALFVGVTNCSEFACKGVTTNRVYGTTRNPWNLERTPGGSSGGAAAAVSAGLCAIALGTDAGGSVRRPAAHTGVVGFKPGTGVIAHPIGFQEPVFANSVVGVMARSVADTRAAMAAMAGFDARDPQSLARTDLPGALRTPAHANGLRVAFSPQLGLGYPVDRDVAAQVEAAAGSLTRRGVNVVRADPEWPTDADESALIPLQFAGLASIHGEAFARDPEAFDPDIATQIERGLALSGTAVTDALLLRDRLYRSLAALFADFDLLIAPTAPVTAWSLERLGPETIDGRTVSARSHAVFTPLFNHTYVPACSVPCGLGDDGLPVGLQVIGPRGGETSVLALAELVEEEYGAQFVSPRSPH